MLNVMEFKAAKSILEEEAKPILKKLIEKYQPGEKEPEKDLVENRYSFKYRKMYALYLKKFAFYDQSAEILNQILKEEVTYYNLEKEDLPEDKLLTIKTDALIQKAKEPQYILKPSLLPEYQVRNTYYMLGKIFVYKLKVAQAEEVLQLAKKISVIATGVEEQLYAANCHRLIKEAHLKVFSPRKKQALDEAEKHIKTAIGYIEKVLGGEVSNYILARALIGLGDI